MYNGKNSAQTMLVSNHISLNGSGNSYIHLYLPSPIEAGDIISAEGNDGSSSSISWKLGTTTSASNKDCPYTLTSNDSFIGATELYIKKNSGAQISSIKIEGLGQISDLALTSSATPNMTIGDLSTITYTTSSTGAVTFTSSDESVATVSNAGVITAVYGGEATITITQAADATYRKGIAKVTVTISETAIIKLKLKDNVTGTIGGTYDVNTQDRDNDKGGCKFGSKGHYAGITLATGNTFQTGDVVEVKIGSSGDGTFIFYDSKEQTNILLETTITPAAGTYRFVLPAAANGKSSLYLVRGQSENSGFNPYVDYIAVYRPDAGFALNTSGFATYSSAENFTVEGADAYTMALNVSAGTLVGTKIADNAIIPAGTGVLLKGSADAGVAIYTTTDDATATTTGNSLHGTTDDGGNAVSVPTGKTIYVLSGDTFKPYTGATFAANKAFFQVDGTDVDGRDFTMSFDGEATGIQAVGNGQQSTANSCYDLQGRKVSQPTKGLYIVNGKKVIIK